MRAAARDVLFPSGFSTGIYLQCEFFVLPLVVVTGLPKTRLFMAALSHTLLSSSESAPFFHPRRAIFYLPRYRTFFNSFSLRMSFDDSIQVVPTRFESCRGIFFLFFHHRAVSFVFVGLVGVYSFYPPCSPLRPPYGSPPPSFPFFFSKFLTISSLHMSVFFLHSFAAHSHLLGSPLMFGALSFLVFFPPSLVQVT